MSDSVREAYAEKIATQGASYEQVTLALMGYDASTAAADVEWRGVVEKLLQGNQLAQMELRELKRMGAMVNPMLDICLKDGEAQAEKFMGRK